MRTLPGEVLGEISEVCKGSSREALVILGKVIDIRDPGEALQIVAPSTEEAIDTPQLSDQEKEEAPVILGQVIDISDPGEALQIVAPSTEEAIDTPQLSDQEKEEALKLLKERNLLYRIGDCFERSGLAGEKRNGLIVYISVASGSRKDPYLCW